MSWVQAVGAAKAASISLTAHGWYNGKDFHPEMAAPKNTYAVYGTSVCEVTIDALTGDMRVDQVDILMDLGNQLNAAVDIGQVQGAYVKSLGYLFTEECKWDE